MDPANESPAVFEKVPVIAALDALSQEPFFIKDLIQQVRDAPQYFQGLKITTTKIRAAFDELLATDYVLKAGRKYKAATKLQDLISDTQAEQNPTEGDEDEAYKCQVYTTVAKSLTSNNGNYDQAECTNTRPQTGRHKRPNSAIQSTPANTAETPNDIRLLPEDEILEMEAVLIKTPRKSKRVRFSDPGPALLSTGLTPAISRTSIRTDGQPSPSRASARKVLRAALSRRRSLPVASSTSAAEQVSPSEPISGTMQFPPLRQVLSGRARRILGRNNLSEEVNKIEYEKREAAKEKRDTVRRLKEQVAAKDKQLGELQEEIEITRQFAIEVNTPASSQEVERDSRVKELEQEIARLNEEIGRHRDHTVDSYAVNEGMGDYHDVDDNDDDFMIIQQDDFGHDMTDSVPAQGHRRQSSLAPSGTQASTVPDYEMAEAGTQADFPDKRVEVQRQQIDMLKSDIRSLHALLENRDNTQQRLLSKLHRFLKADEQHSDNANLDAALDSVLTNLVLAQSKSDDAQATIHAIHSKVIQLGFEGNGIEEILASIGQQFRQARLELEYLSPGENAEGFENSKLLGMLLERVRTLMKNVRDGNQQLEFQVQREAALHDQLGGVRGELDSAKNKIGLLEMDVDEKDRSLEKLQRALDGYRDEVKGLETLVSNLDTKNQRTVAQLQRDMDEAVHDLEEKLGEESTKKQAAEEDSTVKGALLAELEAKLIAAMGHLEEAKAELRITKAEKDDIVRRLENEYRELEEKSRGDVNQCEESMAEVQRQMEGVQTALEGAKRSVANLTASNANLEAKLAQEVKRGIQALDTLQAGMRITMAEKEQVVQKLETKIRELAEEYVEDVNDRDCQIAELEAHIRSLEAGMIDAQTSIDSLTASRNAINDELTLEVTRGVWRLEQESSRLLTQLNEKEEEIRNLQSDRQRLVERHRIATEGYENTLAQLRSQIGNLQTTLENAQLSITNLNASKAALEAQIVKEAELSTSTAEAMQADVIRSLHKYVRSSKLRSLHLSNPQNAENSEDTDESYENGLPPLTPSSIVRFAPEAIRAKGRRKYDSGIGVLEEGEESELIG